MLKNHEKGVYVGSHNIDPLNCPCPKRQLQFQNVCVSLLWVNVSQLENVTNPLDTKGCCVIQTFLTVAQKYFTFFCILISILLTGFDFNSNLVTL